MITINLLAPGKRRPTRLAPTGILPILGIGAVVFVLVMFSIYLSDRAASTRAQLNAVNKQLEALGPVTQQVQKLEQTIVRANSASCWRCSCPHRCRSMR